MIEILKRIERKTLILLICLICLPIIFLIFLALIQGCNSKVTYETYLDKMENAALKYLKDYDLTPSEEGGIANISLDELVDGKYIKSTEKLLKDSSCVGEVNIRLNGSQFKSNDGGLLNSIAHLSCTGYESVTLKDKIMDDLTTSESGVYSYNGGYIYRGDSVNNYIKFMDENYLIIGMDSNGIVKLIKINNEKRDIRWDTKYNIETNKSSGINEFRESDMRRKLDSIYENIDKKNIEYKKKLISYNVCIDKVALNNKTINNSCSTYYEKQIISLPNIWDYSIASLDVNCLLFDSKSCLNYNYFKLNNINSWTLNGIQDDSYEVYYYNHNYLSKYDASDYGSYNLVIYVDGNELIRSGDGSIKSAYELK